MILSHTRYSSTRLPQLSPALPRFGAEKYDKAKTQRLVAAASEQNWPFLAELIQDPTVDINHKLSTDKTRETLIINAIFANQATLVQRLLARKDCKINQVAMEAATGYLTNPERTPQTEDFEILQALLKSTRVNPYLIPYRNWQQYVQNLKDFIPGSSGKIRTIYQDTLQLIQRMLQDRR